MKQSLSSSQAENDGSKENIRLTERMLLHISGRERNKRKDEVKQRETQG